MPHDPLFLATATEAVLRAGEIQLAHFRQPIEVTKKGAIDLVTEVDLAVERMFRALIAERFPDHAVLAEELQEPDEAQRDASHWWIFDPVDGTTNYAHGLPIFCSSLALEIHGSVEIAAVYDPTRRELFTAERGGGAFLNGEPLHVSHTATLLEALLCTGFPYDVHQTLDEVMAFFIAFVGRARAVRRLGSAALDLCYVAAGRLDGFWETRLQPWDTAAAALITEEAGGTITRWDGSRYGSRDTELVASNGPLHHAMLEVLQAVSMDRARLRTG
ncbi:MAG: inositol monophosphatase [Luteitalea sp.]|nr:inositol monophosphatase [Luteitalea sp.]